MFKSDAGRRMSAMTVRYTLYTVTGGAQCDGGVCLWAATAAAERYNGNERALIIIIIMRILSTHSKQL